MTEAGTQVQSVAAPERSQPAQTRSAKSGLYSLQSLAGTVVIAVFVITFIVQAFQIPSESMEKTLLIGDYLLVDKAHYGQSHIWNWLLPYRSIHRQDIIVFRYPVNPNQHFVKRVVAIPGDHVRLVDKHVYVNGVRQDDAYATFRWGWRDRFRDNFPDGGFYGGQVTSTWFVQAQKLLDDGELIVPQDSYFVLGDNRDDSYDSRYWGFVPRENVVGRPLLIYWSMDRSETALGGTSPSDKLSTLTRDPHPARSLLARWGGDVTQLLNSFRWHRVLRIPQ